MEIYKNRLKYFTFLHVFTLILTGILTTDQLYSKYKDVETNKVLEKIYRFQYNQISQSYYRFTGTETGFGFFAPNVKSNGFFLSEVDNSKQEILFFTNEGNSRFSTVVANSTDYLTERRKKNKSESLKKYNDLVIKNIAMSVAARTTENCNKVKLSYYLIDYPSLNSIKKEDNITPNLVKIQYWNYGINK
jgi:hypothetical protein